MGKIISKLFEYSNFLYIILPAASEEIIIGILNLFLSVKGVFTNPGQITLTFIPLSRHWLYMDSAKHISPAFDEQYEAAYGRPL